MIVGCACNPIKYEADLGFLNSAQANSFEYFVRINGTPCKDMDNKIGLCAKRVESNQSLKFEIDSKPYSYTLSVRCTKELNSDFSVNVAKEVPYSFTIKPESFATVKSFTCIGEVFPEDRDQEISANFQVRAIVVDSNYVEREIVTTTKVKKDTYLIFGKHSRYVFLNGKFYNKQPMIKIDPNAVNIGYSESERMRFNYWNF